MLRAAGYSLQANVKLRECAADADRDAKFRYLNEQVVRHQQAGAPVLSVDTKETELVGGLQEQRPEWMPQGSPSGSRCTTSRSRVGKAIP